MKHVSKTLMNVHLNNRSRKSRENGSDQGEAAKCICDATDEGSGNMVGSSPILMVFFQLIEIVEMIGTARGTDRDCCKWATTFRE